MGTARARSQAKTSGAAVAMPSHARMNHESQKAIALPLGRAPKAPVASVPNVADTMAPAGAATRVSTSGLRTRSRRASNCKALSIQTATETCPTGARNAMRARDSGVC